MIPPPGRGLESCWGVFFFQHTVQQVCTEADWNIQGFFFLYMDIGIYIENMLC